jgi:uncharacterized protein
MTLIEGQEYSGPSPPLKPVRISLEYTSPVKPDDPLEGCIGFDWDEGNVEKNWILHHVAFWEAEEIFFNEPLIVKADRPHSASEGRYLALGRTDAGRGLFISFTVRRSLIRIISARDMSRKEARIHARIEA